MAELLKWLFLCVALFAVGDFLGVITKARLSSVFVALLLFLVGFMSGIIPADVIDQAGLTQIGKWAAPFIIFHMGTSINLGELKREWKTVVMSVVAMVVAVGSILIVAPLISLQSALVSIPIVNGGIVATQIMTEGALELGFPLAAALGTFVYAIQKFVGTPPASMCGLKEAEGLLKEYREDKEACLKKYGYRSEEEEAQQQKEGFFQKHKKYFTDFTCLAIVALGCYISVVLGDKTPINYSIWCLILGATVSYFQLVPTGIMAYSKASGLLSMAVFATIIPSLANISFKDLGILGFQTVVVFAAVMIGIYLVVYLTPVWKLVQSKNLAIGIAMAQLLGFPATFLIANEIATAVAENEEEKEVVLKRIMPAYVVAGFASVTSLSIIIAGILVNFL